MNCDVIDDDRIVSDSSDDIESNAIASDLCATENCALLLQNNEKSNDIILRRIVQYTGSGSRFQRKFQNSEYDDDNDNGNDDGNQQKSSRFNTSLRQPYKKSLKRFLFLFGFASTLIILSQLYLLFYYDDRSVQGAFIQFFLFSSDFLSLSPSFSSISYNLLGWEKNRTRRTPVYILPNNKTTILEPTTLCKTDTPILLLIVVFSAPKNFEHR